MLTKHIQKYEEATHFTNLSDCNRALTDCKSFEQRSSFCIANGQIEIIDRLSHNPIYTLFLNHILYAECEQQSVIEIELKL